MTTLEERRKCIADALHYIGSKFREWEEEDRERDAYLDMQAEWRMEEDRIAKWENEARKNG